MIFPRTTEKEGFIGSKWDIFVTLAALLLGARPASAIVTVESFINQIEDIGPCDLANGINDKCGFTDVTDLSLVTSFKDGRGAHEEVGAIRFVAEYGQIGGFQSDGLPVCTGGWSSYDNGDWDVPDRIFTCTEAVAGGCSPGGTPLDNRIDSCRLAPDITGRLDSFTCSDYFGPGYTGKASGATYGCALADFDDPNTDHEDYTFFNYMACHPNTDCFQADPLHSVNVDGGCDMGVPGPFGLTSDQILAGATQEDIWISGTILSMRLPFGIRLANTVYPGVMLNGTRQFDFNDLELSPRMNAALNPSIPDEDRIAWPAVIYSFEANHVIPTPEQLALGFVPECSSLGPDPESHKPDTFEHFGILRPNLCRGQYSGNDAILVFVPDILTGRVTMPNQTSSFVVGDAVIDAAGIRPLSRENVQGCFRGDDPVLGTCTPAFARLGATPPACDYDTAVMVDIRGAYPALRANSPFDVGRFVRYTLQIPLFRTADFTVPDPIVARVTDRIETVNGLTLEPDTAKQPHCEGLGPCPDGEHHLLDVAGTLTLTEDRVGMIRATEGYPETGSTLECHLNQADSVDFIVMDTPVGDETCPNYVLASPEATGMQSIILPPLSGLDGAVAVEARNSEGFTYRFTSPSDQGGGAQLTLYGFQLRVRKDAEWLSDGRGCVTMDCTLALSPTRSANHECLAGDSEPGCEKHLPGPPKTRTWTGLPLVCLGPGRVELDHPGECVASCVTDGECDDGDLCSGTEICDDQGRCQSHSWLNCWDYDQCNGQEHCDPLLGCVAGEPLTCDDGNACNGIESCSASAGCSSSSPPVCDDQDPCNGTEACDPALGCVGGEPLVCDDGDPCNGEETCDPYLGCENGAPVVCDDDDDDTTGTSANDDDDSTSADDDDDTTTGDGDDGGSGCSCRNVDGPAHPSLWMGALLLLPLLRRHWRV